MEVIQIKCKAEILREFSIKDAMMRTASLLDSCIVKGEGGKYKGFHEEYKGFKNYVFDALLPMEKDYLAGSEISFRIRTADLFLANFFFKELSKVENPFLHVFSVETKPIPFKRVRKIYSLTPVLIKNKKNEGDGYWRGNHPERGIDYFVKKIEANLLKKYNQIGGKAAGGELLNGDFCFCTKAKFLNERPIGTKYRDMNFLGDKVEMEIGKDPLSQELAYLSLGCGIGEMNPRGFGFVNSK